MSKTTALQFFKAWLDTIEEKREILKVDWRNSKAFTYLIKGCEDNLITLVADKLRLRCYPNDYYHIDCILYDDECVVPNIPPNTHWFREIRVAFEHENNFKSGLYQEVSHLLLINSDLKVLVTYPNSDTTREMNYLHSIIRGTSVQKRLSDDESFLIIFGYETDFKWEAFVYKEDRWKQILIFDSTEPEC